MKLVQRIGIILLAALVVVGLTWGALQMPAVQSWVGSNNEHGGPPAALQVGQAANLTGDGTNGSLAGAAMTASTTGEDATGMAGTSTSTTAGRPQRPMGGEGGEHNSGGNVLGLVEVGKTLGIVVVVSLVVAAAGWVAGKVRPKRRPAQTPGQAV